MNDNCLKLAQILYSKNIPFCIYRYPQQDSFNIAIEKGFIEQEKKVIFTVAPFTVQSQAGEIQLELIGQTLINAQLIQYFQDINQHPEFDVELPKETTKQEYFSSLQSFLDEIKNHKLEKAVLSRVIYEKHPKDMNVISTFSRLAKKYPNTFVHFLHHPQAGLWMGAAPELLLKKEKEAIFVMALAGTQARSDKRLEYHWREKELEEHLMVGTHIEQVFSQHQYPILSKKGPYTTDAGRVVHLKTDYQFQDKGTSSIKELLTDLHPTPAIGGLPAKSGVECILKYETYDRKYYCGYIGQNNDDEHAEFYVNLRCMQIGKNNIAIFVGGGITSASQPDEEWQETILKSKTMTDIIQPKK
ncbi:MAG: chorismate-binding protein [Chitinophagales bacterium]|nr:chorismate-binding protein [Chitinophagales bacterium]